MLHPEPDDLALLALEGSIQAPTDRELMSIVDHVGGCPACQAEVAAFRRPVAVAREFDAGSLTPPPAHVWDAIAAELGFDQHSVSYPVVTAQRESGRPGVPGSPSSLGGFSLVPTQSTAAETSDTTLPVAPAPDLTTAAHHRAARPGGWRRGLLVAAVVALVGVLGGIIGWTVRGSGPAPAPPPEVVASGALAVVPGGPATTAQSGQAQMVDSASGLRVTVETRGLPAIRGSYEVWLFGPTGRMVSLGTLTGSTGDFPVPHGIDTAAYRTVDISDEAPDGNPAHSGVSILRGRMH